ncbi:MAG: SRPBCC family protein [Nitrospirota bacterium]|nr:SRPBCC family protein [Nitrospirota bacterium]
MRKQQHPSTIEFRKLGLLTHQFAATLFLSADREKAFSFFEDPRNLFEITPAWLDFRMLCPEQSDVHEGAEFAYTIKWLGITVRWKSRIIRYHPPVSFTDIQLEGPYRSWEHLHVFEEAEGGTIMKDIVTYRLPPAALLIHGPVIKKQLRDIFSYRALRIEEWVRGVMVPRGDAQSSGDDPAL